MAMVMEGGTTEKRGWCMWWRNGGGEGEGNDRRPMGRRGKEKLAGTVQTTNYNVGCAKNLQRKPREGPANTAEKPAAAADALQRHQWPRYRYARSDLPLRGIHVQQGLPAVVYCALVLCSVEVKSQRRILWLKM